MTKISKFSLCFFLVIFLSNCVNERQYDFSLKNTLSIFLLANEKGYFFCFPIQYLGDFYIGNFQFTGGVIQIGDYEIPLKRDEVYISIYLNEAANDMGSSVAGFNLIYQKKNCQILLSKMNEPLLIKQMEDDGTYNHYYIVIKKILDDNDIRKIISEYEKGNVYSRFEIWFDLVIDNEPQFGSGILDDFELFDGAAMDPNMFPPNLNFFKVKYLQKQNE